jgi:type I restriction enzyme S subunit
MKNLLTENIDIWTSVQIQKKGNGRGNGSANQSHYGIKKLRELILELAVRGKLVPQDPNDEPASVLLEKIAKEKERLIKEGKIKKQEHLSKITEEEKPFEVPKGWVWARLTELYYSISPSGKKLKSSEISDAGKFPVVDQGKSYIAGYTDNLELLIRIPHPIILFGDHTTEIKYIDFNFVAGADGTKILCPYKMHERYFYTYLLTYKLEDRGYARHFKVLNDNLMALPPYAEQHRIVAKVDELMAICDQLEQKQTGSNAAHQTLVETLLATLTSAANRDEFIETWQRLASNFDILFTTEQSIDQLKRTILQLAVMGKLVSQDPNDEPASVLLKKIADEKARLVKKGKIKKGKPLPEIKEEEKPFNLPEEWKWTRLGPLSANIHYGYTASAEHENDGIRLLRITDIQNDSVNWETVPGCEIEEDKANDYLLENGDILIARTGGTIGKSYLVETIEVKAVFASYLIRVKRIEGTYPPFIKTYLGSQLYWQQLYENSMGTGQPNVNATSLKSLIFPLPPLVEQHRIVAKVDELMALCDKLKDRLKEAQTTQIQLADAIVEQAVG